MLVVGIITTEVKIGLCNWYTEINQITVLTSKFVQPKIGSVWLKFDDPIRYGVNVINFGLRAARNLAHWHKDYCTGPKTLATLDLSRVT